MANPIVLVLIRTPQLCASLHEKEGLPPPVLAAQPCAPSGSNVVQFRDHRKVRSPVTNCRYPPTTRPLTAAKVFEAEKAKQGCNNTKITPQQRAERERACLVS